MSDTSGIASDDPLARQLARLAPGVDVEAGRAVFEARRAAVDVPGDDGPRWWLAAAVVVLLITGVIGVWATRGDDETVPPVATQPPNTTDAQVVEGAVEPGGGFEVQLVEQTTTGFGQAEIASSPEELTALWTKMNPGPPEPAFDFGDHVALVLTRPDNACPDTLTRFDVVDAGDVPQWTPIFEERATACEDPLLSWIYVVALDRAALGDSATVRIPADVTFDVPEQIVLYVASKPPDGAVDDPADGTLTSTGVTLPLPAVGEPALHNTSAGMVWVVAHDDGSVSVLPATREGNSASEDGAISNLQTLVRLSASGGSFSDGRGHWDDHGRALTTGRSNDLVGYAGRVNGSEVEIFTSTATRVAGDPPADVEGEEHPIPDLGEPIDVMTFMTLSSSGPVWRYLDASLVIEDGVGRICDAPVDVSVDQMTGCGDGVALDTQVRSTTPDTTTWFHPPVLAFQDPFRGFTHVVPLGGYSSRNDAVTVSTEPPVTGLPAADDGLDHVPNPVPGTEWTVTLPTLDGHVLDISFLGHRPLTPGELCTAEYEAVAEETADSVTITLTAALLTQVDGAVVSCAVPDTPRTVRVTLDAPLGERRLQAADGTVLLDDRSVLGSSPAEPLSFLTIGDSIMLGAADELTARGYSVDAAASRQLADVVEPLGELVANDLLTDTPVTIHLGNNGPIEAADLGALLDALDDVSNVILMTSHADRQWVDANNALLRAFDDRPNIALLDWAILAEECGDDCFMADGLHLTDAGAVFYADKIDELTGL